MSTVVVCAIDKDTLKIYQRYKIGKKVVYCTELHSFNEDHSKYIVTDEIAFTYTIKDPPKFRFKTLHII